MYDVEARTVCELVDVDVEVLHAGLSSQESVDLIKRLDGPNDLFLKLIIMYQSSIQGANLDTCCSRVLVATSAINAFMEIHADHYSPSITFQRWWWIACCYCRNTTTTHRVKSTLSISKSLYPMLV